MGLFLGKPLWMWGVFFGLVIVLLVFDLGILHRNSREIGVRESLVQSVFYIAISLLFGCWVWFELGAQSGQEFFTGYLVEKTLSMDNIFVISLLFSYFTIPRQYQYRVLFFGIIGVVILRAIMIAIGAEVVSHFSWVLYLFAVFLIITGVKMFYAGDKVPDIKNNPLLKLLGKILRITPQLHGQKFFVTLTDEKSLYKRAIYCTPLFVALVMIEFADIIFAVDSVPAIFVITTDAYIVYTSNIFAILGLRALYFALAAVLYRFSYLKQAMAAILVFIGSKIFIADLLGLEKFPASLSLGVTMGLLAWGVGYSMYRTKKV